MSTVKKSEAPSTPFTFVAYEPQEGEEYMGEPQVEHFRRILLNWKSELMREVDRTVHHMQDEAANFPDPTDRASQESEFSLELRTRDRERKLIKKIEESLENLERGDYGFAKPAAWKSACGASKRVRPRPSASTAKPSTKSANAKWAKSLGLERGIADAG